MTTTSILVHSVKAMGFTKPRYMVGSARPFWIRKLVAVDDSNHETEITLFSDSEEPLKFPSTISADLLYAIGMESRAAYENMELLCKALGVPYPPNQTKETT
jgi:hypothetical protein